MTILGLFTRQPALQRLHSKMPKILDTTNGKKEEFVSYSLLLGEAKNDSIDNISFTFLSPIA
ncbi:MAG: hypothetical protein DRG82_11925 [Deltaproteobacteria bacterium]|nr:MAG: hypothetical protein DRG82_11925 [Deltaproteobacteria bacterium]